jgi:hypothetical protein
MEISISVMMFVSLSIVWVTEGKGKYTHKILMPRQVKLYELAFSAGIATNSQRENCKILRSQLLSFNIF